MFKTTKRSIKAQVATLEAENARLKEQVEELLPLARAAHVDPLTGLHNRRYFDERFPKEKARALRTHRPVSLALLDLDRFRTFNEVGGHPLGDRVLSWFGDFLRDNARSFDVTCRIGGDEFALILPSAGRTAAGLVVARLAARLAHSSHPHDGSGLPRLSFSWGIAAFPHDGTEPIELLCAADASLFEQKRTRVSRPQNASTLSASFTPPSR